MIINEADLKGTEYKILQKFNRKIFSFSELLNDIKDNEYSRLENYYKDKFEFIKFKDEEIIVENNKKDEFIVFGRNSNGFFVINKNKEIWLMPFYVSDIKEPIFINSSFKMDILKIDSYSIDSLFYQNYIFSIENAELPIHFTPIDYVNSGRHRIPE